MDCLREKYALLTKFEVKMVGYWPNSFFAYLTTEKKSSRVHPGHGKPGNSWNLSISFSRPGKSWNLIVSP